MIVNVVGHGSETNGGENTKYKMLEVVIQHQFHHLDWAANMTSTRVQWIYNGLPAMEKHHLLLTKPPLIYFFLHKFCVDWAVATYHAECATVIDTVHQHLQGRNPRYCDQEMEALVENKQDCVNKVMETNRKAFTNIVFDADGMETDKLVDEWLRLESLHERGKLELRKMAMY